MNRSFWLGLVMASCTATPPPPPPGCTASTCAGCCDAMGQCQQGTSTSACGRLGLLCDACEAGQTCVAGLCQGAILGGGTAVAAGGSAGSSGGGSAGGALAGGSTGGGSVSGGGAAGGQTGLARRFRTTPLRFGVPGPIYNALRGTTWAVLDLTGDGRADLVVTADPSGGVLIAPSGPIWNVFAGTAAGFSATATSFSTPSSSTLTTYTATESAAPPQVWSTFDVSGDGLPDLVQTMSPTPTGGPYFSGPSLVTDGWLLKQAGRGGLAGTGTNFSVPRVPNLGGSGIDRPGSNVAGRRWALAFLNADRLLDLVITADPQTDGLWGATSNEWVVCNGTAQGFGEFNRCARFRVPSSGTQLGFNRARSSSANAGQVWDLLDMDGDGREDLVQTMNPGAPGATFLTNNVPTWRVWLNTNTAGLSLFSTTPLDWAVPSGTFATPDNAAAPQFWTTMDLDHDRVQDLVVTSAPNTGQPFLDMNREPVWRVYFGTAQRGFSSTPTEWPIPRGPMVDGFRSTSGPEWGLIDLTFDGVPDLVQFQNGQTRTAFTDANGAFWNVYPAIP